MSKVLDFFSSFSSNRDSLSVKGCLNMFFCFLFMIYLVSSGYNSVAPLFFHYIDILTREEILCIIFGTSSTSEIVWAFAVGILSAGIYLLSRYIKNESEISYVDLVFLFVFSTLLTFRIYYTIIFAYNIQEIKPNEVIQTTVVKKYRYDHKSGKGNHIIRVSNDIIFYVDNFIAHAEIEDDKAFGNYHVGDTINVEICRGCLGYPVFLQSCKVCKYGEERTVKPKPPTLKELKNKRVPHVQSICGVSPDVLNHYYIAMDDHLKEVNMKVFGCINGKFNNSPKDVYISEKAEFVALSDGTITDVKVTNMSMWRNCRDMMVDNSTSALLKAVRSMDKWEPVLLVETNRPEKTRVRISAYYNNGKMSRAKYEMYDIAAEDKKYYGQEWEY